MGNSIVVTRAPRLKTAKYKDLEPGQVYLTHSDDESTYGQFWVARKTKDSHSMIHPAFPLPYGVGFGVDEKPHKVVVFLDFAHMCQWWLGGRKLEDLQGDLEEEIVTIESVKRGTVFSYIYPPLHPTLGYGVYMKVDDGQVVDLETGEIRRPENTKIRPIDPALGDSITITATK